MKSIALLLVGVFAFAISSSAQSPKNDPGNNNPPPVGAILDLNGTPIPGGGNSTYQLYAVDFTATLPNTAISFAFREDPAFISFTNASVFDQTSESANLLKNGDFSQGLNESGSPLFWTYSNQYGAGSGGVVDSGPGFCYTYNFCWYDGAVQAYDVISQMIPTIVGHTYRISFYVADNSGKSTFSELSTNGDTTNTGGNGINVTVYAEGGLPVSQSSDTKVIQFHQSAGPQTQIATIGNPSDPAAHSLALTLTSVTNPINVSVIFFYEKTDVSNGFVPGIGVADGDCEKDATEATDFDCRLVPDFVYPPDPNLPAGDKLVPHIIPSHNNLGVWVRVIATLVSDGTPAMAGRDYGFGVDWYYAWFTNPLDSTPNADNPFGWNYRNPQMHDRPGANADIAFVANISTITKNCDPNCVGTADPGKGGHTGTLNDIVVDAPPNPPSGVPDVVQVIVPQNGRNPFPYLKGLPMLVAFTLENESAEKSDPTALTLPHSVSVATLNSTGTPITVQFPKGFPTTFTYNPFLKVYYIFLSPAPYTPRTVYTMQIDSDLFPQPVLVNFVVKNSLF
jgi:hypothetical protein